MTPSQARIARAELEAVDIERAVGEFAGAIAMRHRLAYSRPRDIDDDVIRRTSQDDLPRLRDAVSRALDAIGG